MTAPIARRIAGGRIAADAEAYADDLLTGRLGADAAAETVVEQLRRLPATVDETTGPPEQPWLEPLTDEAALLLARAPAIVAHARAQRRFRETSAETVPLPELVQRVNAAEARYVELLRASHACATTTDRAALEGLYEHVLAWAVDELPELSAAVGATAVAARGAAFIGLRISNLCRRSAMLSAGVAQLIRRASTPSGASGLRRIAAGRTRLSRYEPDLWTATAGVGGPPDARSARVVGIVTETGWVDRPEIPYSFVRLSGIEVRVHRRDVQRCGVQPGAWFWAHGKVEELDGAIGLVAHFEGPGSHAREVWEDWLADEVRPAYDLYPLVVEAEWELADASARNGMGDYLSRLA